MENYRTYVTVDNMLINLIFHDICSVDLNSAIEMLVMYHSGEVPVNYVKLTQAELIDEVLLRYEHTFTSDSEDFKEDDTLLIDHFSKIYTSLGSPVYFEF